MEKTAVDYLLLAEQAALSNIGKPGQLANGSYIDYSRLNAQLELAHEIGALRKRASDLFGELSGSSRSEAGLPPAHQSRTDEAPAASKRPLPLFSEDAVYFIDGATLYKYALGNREGGGVYRRKVPARDAEACCSAILELLERDEVVTARRIEQLSGVNPPYKVQAVLAALVASGMLEHLGRGRYTIRETADPHCLFESLVQLPKRWDWVERFERR